MSMAILIEQPVVRTVKRVQTVLRVSEGERYVGDILLDGQQRVWRRANTIPPDVVLKVLMGFTRQGETCGKVFARGDNRAFLWHLVGSLPAEGDI
jgi:hypothetical protein